MPSILYQQVNLKPQMPYLINTFIREYDMSKANISVLRSANMINDATYQYLYYSDRMVRQTAVGNMIRDNKEVAKVLKRGILDAKRHLFEANQIEDWEVLSIKNDAVFVVGKQLLHTQFGDYYKFAEKNVYTIFLKLEELEVYYYDQFINGELFTSIDVKGINDEMLPLHQNGMIDLICEICYKLQREKIEDTLSYISKIYDDYINLRLPVDYYRNFDYKSKYMFTAKFSAFFMDTLPQEYLPYIDINRNLLILRDLMFIISNIYSNQKKGRG